jgi:prophage maintenance system killer protein
MLSETVKSWPTQWLQEGMEKGIEQGRQEGKIEIALKMIAKGRSFEEISDITELSTDQIKKLAENNKVSEPATKYKAKRKPTKPRKK